MSSPSQPTRADDCERVLRILSDAPSGGLSLDEIQAVTVATGEKWSLRTVNAVLCDLGNQVGHEKTRIKSGKVTKFFIKP